MIISQKALEQLNQIKEKHNKFVRLSLKGSGCAGYSYKFEIVEKKEDTEVLIDNVLLIDELYLFILRDSIVDYFDNGIEKYFYLHIPLAKSKCGCGKSFSL